MKSATRWFAVIFALGGAVGLAQADPAMTRVTPADRCGNCGTITSIDAVEHKGDASGAGAVIGAVIGGVVGHQFGSGRGQDAATVGGAVAGGVAGHQAEKRHNATDEYYRVAVKMDDGSRRDVNVRSADALSVGTRVRLVGRDMEVIGS